MADLKETLSTLSDLVPVIGPQVAGVRAQGEHLKHAAGQLLTAMEARLTEVEQLSTRLHEELDDVREDGEAHVASLDEAARKVEASAEEITQAVDTAGGALDEATSDADEALDALQADLSGLAGAVEDSRAQVASSVEDLGGAVEEARRAVTEAAEAAVTGTRSLVEAVQSAGEQVSASVDGLRSRLDDLLARAQARVDETMNHLSTLRAAHASALEREGEHLEARIGEMVSSAQQRLESEVDQKVEAGIQEALSALGELDASLQRARERSAEARDAVQQGLGLLATALEPMPAAIESVRAAADQVGLSWS